MARRPALISRTARAPSSPARTPPRARRGGRTTRSPSSAQPAPIRPTMARASRPAPALPTTTGATTPPPARSLGSDESTPTSLVTRRARRCGWRRRFTCVPTRPLSGDEALQLGALRRKPLRTATYGLDGSALQSQAYSVTSHTYASLLVPSSLPGGDQVAVPYCVTSTEQRLERQATAVSTRTVSYLAVSDEGDITSQRTQAQRAGTAAPDQDVTTTTTLATGGVNLRLPARVTQTMPDGTVISATVCFYDGDAFVGLPEGQASAGLITRIEDLAFDDAFVLSVWGASPPDLTQYGYHRLPGDTSGWWKTRRAHQRTTGTGGPVLAPKGPLGAVQTLQYDAAGQRIVEVTDAAGNKLSA